MATSSSHSEEFAKLHKQLEQIILSQANFANTLHDISECTSLLETKSSPPPSQPISSRPLKSDLPTFDGNDALGWIFKVTQFFDYHQTPP